MMPEWHQLVCMSGHVKESETPKILQLYATSIFQVHSFVCQLDYMAKVCRLICHVPQILSGLGKAGLIPVSIKTG